MVRLVLVVVFVLGFAGFAIADKKHGKAPAKPAAKKAMPAKKKPAVIKVAPAKRKLAFPTIMFEQTAIPLKIHTIRVDRGIACSISKPGVMVCSIRLQGKK